MQQFQFGNFGKIRFHDLPGEGTPLLFIHGLGCASSCDYPQVAGHASLSGYRRILIDLFGAGFSDRPDDFGYGTSDHAHTIIALADHLGLDTLNLYGHSMGGSIAIEAGLQLGRRVQHLVLSEPNLHPGGGVFSRTIAGIKEADYLARGHGRIIAEAQSGSSVWAASMSVSAPIAVRRAAQSLVTGHDPSWFEMLTQLPARRSVIYGEQSLPDPDVEMLNAQGIETPVLAGVGHAMAWEDPAGLAQLIASQINRV